MQKQTKGTIFVFQIRERTCEREKIPVNSLILFRAKKEEKLHASEATSLIRVGRADRMASDPAADGAKRLIRFFK